MGSRDSGWLQLYSENAQEAYDNMLMAHRIAESPEVMLPVMVCQDGFITSHAVENILLEDDEAVKAFVGEYHPKDYLLNPARPVAFGPYGISAYYMELKKQQTEAMERSAAVIREVSRQYGHMTGRYYDLIEEYRMEDAQLAVICIGSSAGTGKAAVDELRGQGIQAGLLKIRAFRPFPGREIAAALARVKAVGIMDKADGFSGSGGPLGAEVRAALYQAKASVPAVNFIYGLGGRDVRVDDFYNIFGQLGDMADGAEAPMYRYIGVRE